MISLYITPYTLLVDKVTRDMYNDNWFHDYLAYKFPNMNLPKINDCFINLYKQYLKSGDVYRDNKPISNLNTVIKYDTYNKVESVLLFNGDYISPDGKLHCSNVVDIGTDVYITNTRCFYGFRNTIGCYETEDKFLGITNTLESNVYIHSKKKVYILNIKIGAVGVFDARITLNP